MRASGRFDWRGAATLFLLLLPGLGLILLSVGTVIAMAVAQSLGYFNFSGEGGFTLDHWAKQFASPLLGISALYSLKIATVSAFASVALAYPMALWLQRGFVGATIMSGLLKAPMMVPGLVAAFLFVNVIAYHGFLNEALIWLGLIAKPMRMQNDTMGIGVIILQVWKNTPFALLLMTGAVNAIHLDLLDAARDLGAGSWARFRLIVLPLTSRTLQAAMIIIFIGAAGDYSFQVVAGPTSVNSLSQYMYTVQHEFGQWNEAAVVAVVLMTMALLGSVAIAALTRLLVAGGKR